MLIKAKRQNYLPASISTKNSYANCNQYQLYFRKEVEFLNQSNNKDPNSE